MADALLGGIVINEILVDPNGAINYDTDGSGTAEDTDEFVELYNASASAIDISGLELWDQGVGNYFTFPPGTVLQPGGHAMVLIGLSEDGNLPSGGPDDLFFDAGRDNAAINNGGDTVVVYDPANDEYIAAYFNGVTQADPTEGEEAFSTFSTTATQSGAGEDFGFDTDGRSLQRTSDGTDTFSSDTPTPGTTNVCFVKGTAIETAAGPKPVERLVPGDLVRTLDHGWQSLRWVFAKTWSGPEVAQREALAPVRISKGAMGLGLPTRDLWVSQHHRLVVRGQIAKRMFGSSAVLVAARHLARVPGVDIDTTAGSITYFHLLCDRHEVLFAEGLPAESLYLGSESLRSIPAEGRRELESLLGACADSAGKLARHRALPFAEGRQARTLVRRITKNGKDMLWPSAAGPG